MKSYNLEVTDHAHGMMAKSKFDTIVIEEGWLAANDITQSYYEENKDKLHSSASLLRDFTDQEFLESGTAVSYTHLTLPTNREV